MAYELIDTGEYLLIRLYGLLDADCYRKVIDDLGRTEDTYPVVPNRLIDLTAVEKFELDYSVMAGPAENRKGKNLRNPIKAAFVAPNQLSLGLTRMFIALVTNPKVTHEVFKNKADAEKWLAESRNLPSRH